MSEQTITSLKAQRRRQERVSVYLDGEFAFGLEAVVAAALSVGQTLSAAEIDSLQDRERREQARLKALRYLSYRPRSTAEVARHLRDKGYVDELIDAVVQRLVETGLLDDAAFAQYWVEQRETFRPRSRLALRQELAQKGISRGLIEAAVRDLDEPQAARQAASKQAWRWRNLSEVDFRAKVGAFLARRGFTYDIINEITRELWQQQSADADAAT